MATLTIRKLDEDVKRRLRIRAAEHGRSMEEEARTILAEALEAAKTGEPTLPQGEQEHPVQAIRRIVERVGGFDIDVPAREKEGRHPPRFEK
jgi:antitoxin FitA